MFTTEAVILQDVADALRKEVAELPAWWQGLVRRCQASAYQEIVGVLIARGYAKSQIDQWDRGDEFERSQALYYLFSTPQGGGMFDKEAIDRWDKRKDLRTVLLSIGGKWQRPGESPGTIGCGRQSSENDIFTWPDPDGGGLGDVTRW